MTADYREKRRDAADYRAGAAREDEAMTGCAICWQPECRAFATPGFDLYAHRREIDLRRRERRGPLTIWQRRAEADAVHQHQQDAARAFGEPHGWTLSTRAFGVTVLARRGCTGNGDGFLPLGGNGGHPWDHPYFYRTGRRAAAVAAHLYEVAGAAAWAARVGLVASFPPEPSWWNAPATTLVLYEPAATAAEIAARTPRERLAARYGGRA